MGEIVREWGHVATTAAGAVIAAAARKVRAKPPPRVTRRVWTWGHRRDGNGDRANYPLAADVAATGPFPLGKGYFGYLVRAPDGHTFVAEAKTGAFFGSTIAEVSADVAEGDPDVIDEQIANYEGDLPDLEVVEPEEFWRAMGRDGPGARRRRKAEAAGVAVTAG